MNYFDIIGVVQIEIVSGEDGFEMLDVKSLDAQVLSRAQVYGFSPHLYGTAAPSTGHTAWTHRRHLTCLSQSPSRTIDSNTNCWGDSRGGNTRRFTPVDHETQHKET